MDDEGAAEQAGGGMIRVVFGGFGVGSLIVSHSTAGVEIFERRGVTTREMPPNPPPPPHQLWREYLNTQL